MSFDLPIKLFFALKKPYPGLILETLLGLLQLGRQGSLLLGEGSDLVLGLLQLAGELRGLLAGAVLLGLEVLHLAVGLVQLGIQLRDLGLHLLGHLLAHALGQMENKGGQLRPGTGYIHNITYLHADVSCG